MATKIKDQATAERAALKLNEGIEAQTPSEPNTPRERTTSEKLFPEFTTDDGGVINRPVKPYTDAAKVLPVTATLDPATQGQTPPAASPTAPVYISEADLKGKMAKLKVDGIEQDVPAESLIKTNQLERHLNTQLMNLAEERRQLESDRRKILSQPPEPIKKSEPPVKKTAQEEVLEARILQMQQQMESLQQTMLPAIQEAGKKRVSQMVKDRIGSDDFDSYFDRVRESALSEFAKPEVANNPQARAYFDSDAYYFQKYQEMKLKDLMTKPVSPTPTNPSAPVLATESGAPVVVNNQGRPVSIPNFESSGGVPSKVGSDASWQSTYNALFQRAQASGAQEDWVAVYRHKVSPRE